MILCTCALSLILYFLMDEWWISKGKTVDGIIALTLMVCHRLNGGAAKRSALDMGTSALVMGTSARSLMMQDSWSPIHSLPHIFADIFMAIHSCPHIIAGTFMAIIVLNQLRWILVNVLASLILNHSKWTTVVLPPNLKWTWSNLWQLQVPKVYVPRKPPFSHPSINWKVLNGCCMVSMWFYNLCLKSNNFLWHNWEKLTTKQTITSTAKEWKQPLINSYDKDNPVTPVVKQKIPPARSKRQLQLMAAMAFEEEGDMFDFLGINFAKDGDKIGLTQAGLIDKVMSYSGMSNATEQHTPAACDLLGSDKDGASFDEEWSY
jgi:hypothetical protein